MTRIYNGSGVVTFLDCNRPISGCHESHAVYWNGDCDNDGINDHVCSRTTNDKISIILSSRGCGDWKKNDGSRLPSRV